MEVEVHPHKPFVPANARFLILGSFPGKNNVSPSGDEWFYAAPRNQFWKILSAVYDTDLSTTQQKKERFDREGIAIADIFLKVQRRNKTNSDSDLIVIEYNTAALAKILEHHKFEQIFTTSKFVEKEFRKLFPELTNILSLPSPSPRYATLSMEQKIEVYREKLT